MVSAVLSKPSDRVENAAVSAASEAQSLKIEARKAEKAFDVNAWLKSIPVGERVWEHVRQVEDEQKRVAIEAELKRRKLWGRSQLMSERVMAEMLGSPVTLFLTRTYAGRVPTPKKVEQDRRASLRLLRRNIHYGVNGRRVAAGLPKLKKAEAPVLRFFSLDEVGEVGGRQHIHAMVFCGSETIADETPGAGRERAMPDFIWQYDRHGQKIPLQAKDGSPRLDKRGKPLFKLLWPKGHYTVKRIVIPENGVLDEAATNAAKYLCGYLENENSRKKASLSPPIGFVKPLDGRKPVASKYYERWCAKEAEKQGDLQQSPVVNAAASRDRMRHRRDKRQFGTVVAGKAEKARLVKAFVPVGLKEKSFVHQWLEAVRSGVASAVTASEAIRVHTYERRLADKRQVEPIQIRLPGMPRYRFPERRKVVLIPNELGRLKAQRLRAMSQTRSPPNAAALPERNASHVE